MQDKAKLEYQESNTRKTKKTFESEYLVRGLEPATVYQEGSIYFLSSTKISMNREK